MPFPVSDMALIVPELFLTLAACAVLVAAAWTPREREGMLAGLSVGALAVTGALLPLAASWAGSLPRSAFGGMIVLDAFSLYFKGLVILATIATILFSLRFVGDSPYPGGEYYALLLFSVVGMLFMASGTNLVSIWVALELMALSQYVLAGWFKREARSVEAAAKYFVLGAFSSGILLYGLSLVYGATGTLDLAAIAKVSAPGGGAAGAAFLPLGMVLLLCGFFFKVASAPFHVWAPDVYEGAPTPISAFFAVAPKVAAYAIFARVFLTAFAPRAADWALVVAASAAVTMVVGNVGALLQKNVKRMLGYSSIGHAGYALLGFLGYGNEFGAWSVLVYLAAYALMTTGAFGLVVLLEAKGYAAESVDDFNGLAKKNMLAAVAMLVFLLSLAGIPPTAGFVGKYFLFSAAMKAGWAWLALLGVLMSVVSLFFYFRIVRAMFLVDGEGELRWTEQPAVAIVIVLCAVGTLLVGILPQPLLALAKACVPN